MKLSVYTSLFNYSPDKFDLEDSIRNWSKYSDEIVIATFPDQVDTIHDVLYAIYGPYYKENVNIVSADTRLDDPLFDGKLKNAALQNCINEVVIQQDMDERIGGKKEYWIENAKRLLSVSFPMAYYIPVIDLYKDYDHYKSLGVKWYLHTRQGTNRGPVDFAKRPDGTIDTDKSDTCELINDHGNLINAKIDQRFQKALDPEFPFVAHLGYLDLEKRVENNKFWSPIWSARNGSKVEVATDIETLEKENKAIPHGIKQNPWF